MIPEPICPGTFSAANAIWEAAQLEQRSVDRRFLDQLPAEIESWQGQGIITPQQGQAIIDTYPAPAPPRGSYGRLVTVLAILGVVLLGLGVILFFASNWGEIPRTFKLAMFLIGVPTTYIIGYWLRYSRGYHRVGMAAIFLATLFYGAGVHLVAQAYNVPVNDPQLFLFWFLGVLPVAYVTRSQAILVLSILLFLGAVGFRVPLWLDNPDAVPFLVFPLYLVLGLMLFGLGRFQAQFDLTRSYARAYEIFGMLTTFGALYLLTFRFWFEEFRRRDLASAGTVTWEFWLVLFAATALAALFLGGTAWQQIRIRRPLLTLPYELVSSFILLVGVFLLIYLPGGNDLTYPLIFNALLLLGIVGLVFLGYFRGEEVWINIALIFFGVDVFARYFEFSFDLFDRSLVFVGAGSILLAGGFLLERGRRRVVERMRTSGGEA